MKREFAIVRVKKQVVASWEFPFTHDEVDESPLAGPLDEVLVAKLDAAVGRFPFARRTKDGRRAWTICAPGRGEIDVWFTTASSSRATRR